MSTAEPSFERINYSVRPAKATERHMLLEAFGRLSPYASLRDYLYIGFGSTFFVDFRLMHQRYGTRRMFSIEREVKKKPRFELNRPLRSVKMLYGNSTTKLLDPVIPWSHKPAIVWLDYEDPLDLSMLADCARVLTRASNGSLLLVTVPVEAGQPKRRRERWEGRLGEWLPFEDTDATLDHDRIAELGFDVLTEHADQILETSRPTWRFEPLFRFRYRDSTRMATWGGLLIDSKQPACFGKCRFNQLSFVRRRNEETYHLEVPNLTPTERALIESRLPGGAAGARASLRRHAVPEAEVDRLADVYRYAPEFVETFA